MEGIGENLQEEELKSQTAIRCAKAALLLYSLKNATNNSTTNVPRLEEDEEKIEMLRIELVKEKQKMKKLRIWIGMSLLSYLTIVVIFLLILKSIW